MVGPVWLLQGDVGEDHYDYLVRKKTRFGSRIDCVLQFDLVNYTLIELDAKRKLHTQFLVRCALSVFDPCGR